MLELDEGGDHGSWPGFIWQFRERVEAEMNRGRIVISLAQRNGGALL